MTEWAQRSVPSTTSLTTRPAKSPKLSTVLRAIGLALALLGALVVIAGWYACFRWRTTCQAITTKGKPCRENVYGVLRACHRIEHRRQKRRAIWGTLSATEYPGDRVARMTPLAIAPAFKQHPQPPRTYDLPPQEIRIARASLWFTAIGTIAGVIGLFASVFH